MSSFFSQLRQIVRRLWRAPVFTVITLITLAAGVGANIAVFSVVEGVLLKPLPYPHPESLVGVWHTAPGLNFEDVNMAPSNYFIYREQNRVFEDVGIYQGDSVSVTGQGNPEQVQALDVTDGVLPILGLKPVLGRWFNRVDDSPSGPDTVMLSYDYWRSRFGSNQVHRGTNHSDRRQSAPSHRGDAEGFSLPRSGAARAVSASSPGSKQDYARPVQL